MGLGTKGKTNRSIRRRDEVKLRNKRSKYVIGSDMMKLFNEQLKWRENVYGTQLPTIQKIKAARAVSHIKYPTSMCGGRRGHNIRDKFRTEILNLVNVDYKLRR